MFLKENYRLPAEWEPQSAVQLTWPHAGTDWAPMLDEISETYRQMVAAIERYEPVLTVSSGNTLYSTINVHCSTDDTWARDHGFITLVNDRGNARLLDFQFNGWGEKFPASQDNAINRHIFDEAYAERHGYQNTGTFDRIYFVDSEGERREVPYGD